MQQQVLPLALAEVRVPMFHAGFLLESPLPGLVLTLLVPLIILFWESGAQ